MRGFFKKIQRVPILTTAFRLLLCMNGEVLHILRHTPKNHKNPAEGSVGDDKLLG